MNNSGIVGSMISVESERPGFEPESRHIFVVVAVFALLPLFLG